MEARWIGPFPAVLFNHGRGNGPQQHTHKLTITEAAQILGPVFVKHGYVFLYLFRRREGLSAGQGAFIGDILQREEAAKGEEARKHLQFVLMTADHLDDVSAGLSFLKNLPEVDARHSHRQRLLRDARQVPGGRACPALQTLRT